MSGSKYSFSLTTFSPSGELVQIKHALAAITAGATSLGIKATNGVVLATEKKMPSTLVDETSISKIQLLTDEIGITYSGMGPDLSLIHICTTTYHSRLFDKIPFVCLCFE